MKIILLYNLDVNFGTFLEEQFSKAKRDDSKCNTVNVRQLHHVPNLSKLHR